MQRSLSSTSSLPGEPQGAAASGSVTGSNGVPPSIDSLFPMQMSLRHLKRTAVASVLLQNNIPGLASPVVLSILGDILGQLLQSLALRIAHLELDSTVLLLDLALTQSILGSGAEEEVSGRDLLRQRPFVLEQLEEFVREVVSKPPKIPGERSCESFGALEATGMLPKGFQLTPSNTKIKRLAQL